MAPRKKKRKTKKLPKNPSAAQVKNFHRYLKYIYTTPSQGASFTGAEKLLKEVDRRGYYTNVKLENVQEFLDSLTTYSLFKRARRKFPRPPVYVTSVRDQVDIDLVDISRLSVENFGVTFLLTCVEVLSRYAFVRPLKSKEGKVVASAMRDILEESGKKYVHACTDLGSEFKASYFQKVMKDYGIIHFFAGGSGSCTIVERFHRSLRSKLNRYMWENQTDTYLDKLQDIVTSYNHTFHSTIKMRPSDVNDANENLIYQRLYLNTKGELKKPKVKYYKFQVGDKVRISYRRGLFDREVTQRWSQQLYTVDSRKRQWNINMYVLRDCENEVLQGRFYEAELSRANIHDNSLYKIEKILDERTNLETGVREVRVKYQGYPTRCAEWISKTSITRKTKAV